jgi:hypothetical protein
MDENELTDLMWQHLKDVCAYNPAEAKRLVLVTKNSVSEAVSKMMLDKSIVVSRIQTPQ